MAPVGTPCCRYLPDVLLVKYLPGGGFMEGGGAPPPVVCGHRIMKRRTMKRFTLQTQFNLC